MPPCRVSQLLHPSRRIEAGAVRHRTDEQTEVRQYGQSNHVASQITALYPPQIARATMAISKTIVNFSAKVNLRYLRSSGIRPI